MAAETSSPAATSTVVVEPAAAIPAALNDEPMPATSAAAAESISGVVITKDIAASHPGQPEIGPSVMHLAYAHLAQIIE